LVDDGAMHVPSEIEFHNPYHSKSSYRLPGLRFGTTYSVASFAVGIAGNLPRLLCTDDDPTLLDPKKLPNVTSIPVQKLVYRRRVPVGPLRIVSTRDFPPVPPGVHPLTRSLLRLADETHQEQMANGGGKAAAARAQDQSTDELLRSLVLLIPQQVGEK